jgi:hypothetical protein
LPDFGEASVALGRGSGGTRPGAHLGLAGDRSWVEGVANEGARRHAAMAAAAVEISAMARKMPDNV